MYSPGCPGTHSVDQAGLELRNLPASASQGLGLRACATTPSSMKLFIIELKELMLKFDFNIPIHFACSSFSLEQIHAICP